MNIQRVFKKPGVVITFVLIDFVFSMSSSPASPPLTKCNIRIDNPHFSESLQRGRGMVAVKVNARSKCNKPMSNLVLTVKIHKKGFMRNYEVASEDVILKGPILANRVIKNQKTYIECQNAEKSKYYGEAFATATIRGKQYKTLHVFTEKTISFKCGT